MTSAIPLSRLCVSVARRDREEILPAAAAAGRTTDMIEIRLDALRDRAAARAAVDSLPAAVTTPLLFTNRAAWEGGTAREPEEQRLAPLLAALADNRAWVDIELRTAPDLRRRVIAAARRPSTDGARLTRADTDPTMNSHPPWEHESRVIVSWHDFDATPDAATLRAILLEQYESGADVGKMVTMAHSRLDVLRVLALQEQAAELDFPLIAFGMGESGKISRLASCLLGGFMTYAAEDAGAATAPGQLPASKLRRLEQLLRE